MGKGHFFASKCSFNECTYFFIIPIYFYYLSCIHYTNFGFQYNIEKKVDSDEEEESEDEDDCGGGGKKADDDDPAASKFSWKLGNFRHLYFT